MAEAAHTNTRRHTWIHTHTLRYTWTHTHIHTPLRSLCPPVRIASLSPGYHCDRSDFSSLLATAALLQKAFVASSGGLAQWLGKVEEREMGSSRSLLAEAALSSLKIWEIPEGGIGGCMLCKWFASDNEDISSSPVIFAKAALGERHAEVMRLEVGSVWGVSLKKEGSVM